MLQMHTAAESLRQNITHMGLNNHALNYLSVSVALSLSCVNSSQLAVLLYFNSSNYCLISGYSMHSRALLGTLLNCDRKAQSKKASFTFGRDLRPKAREQDSATESRH